MQLTNNGATEVMANVGDGADADDDVGDAVEANWRGSPLRPRPAAASGRASDGGSSWRDR